MRRLSDGERDLWDEMQRDAAPVITMLRNEHVVVKRYRNLPCGHRLEAGESYREIVYKADSDLVMEYDCPRCWADMMAGHA